MSFPGLLQFFVTRAHLVTSCLQHRSLYYMAQRMSKELSLHLTLARCMSHSVRIQNRLVLKIVTMSYGHQVMDDQEVNA